MPLDTQFGVDPKKNVPDALQAALFGQPELAGVAADDPAKVPPLRTYAILDAAKVQGLPEMLEASGLEHRCLFKGEALDELGDVAPWIVQLDEESSFTRNLFTEGTAPWQMWDKQPGIYIRSHAMLDELWRHFRKFTRIQNEEGKWHFLAFWSNPMGAQLFLRGNDPAINPIVQKIFALPKGNLTIVLASEDVCAVINNEQNDTAVKPRWLLTKPAWEFIRQLRREQQFDEVIKITWRHAAPHVAIKKQEFVEALRNKRDLWFKIGFWRRDHLAKLCSWEALLGPHFLENYGNGTVHNIIKSSQSPHQAIARIEALLDSP